MDEERIETRLSKFNITSITTIYEDGSEDTFLVSMMKGDDESIGAENINEDIYVSDLRKHIYCDIYRKQDSKRLL